MTAVQRLTAFADFLQTYGAEQAIIYVYGLPGGGAAERHQMLIADIRSLVGASPAIGSSHRLDEPENSPSPLPRLGDGG